MRKTIVALAALVALASAGACKETTMQCVHRNPRTGICDSWVAK